MMVGEFWAIPGNAEEPRKRR